MNKKAVLYARFSCSKQREESIEDQLRICREYATREGYDVVAEYCDNATSGRTDKRPEFQRMVMNAGESDAVIVYAMDRFSRDPYDAPLYKHKLKNHGVAVLSATERITDSPEGMLLEKVIEGVAAMESAHNSIRTKRSMEGNAKKCQWNGNRVFGYGVGDDKRYVIDESQAAFVREAFSRRLDGESPAAIASDFAVRGVKTYRGKPCSATMVENMLRNVRYTGLYKWGDVEVKDGMPAIIDKTTFDKVGMAPRAKRRKDETWREYALSGKSVCLCGHNLIGKSAHGNGGCYCYYQCGVGCGQTRPVRADWVEESICVAIQKILSDDAECLRVAEKVEAYAKGSENMAKLNAARKSKADAEKELGNLIDAMKSGINHPSMQSEIDAANERKERAERDIIFLEAQTDESFDKNDFVDFLRYGASMDSKTVLDAFIGQVVLLQDAIAVTLNYSDKDNEPAYLELEWFAEPMCGSKNSSGKSIEPAYSKLDWFDQTNNGSHHSQYSEPFITVVNGTPVIVLPRAS